MTFNEARRKFARIAGKKTYRAMGFQLTEAEEGVREVECSLYIDNQDWVKANTWERALKKMRELIKPKKRVCLSAKEAPPNDKSKVEA